MNLSAITLIFLQPSFQTNISLQIQTKTNSITDLFRHISIPISKWSKVYFITTVSLIYNTGEVITAYNEGKVCGKGKSKLPLDCRKHCITGDVLCLGGWRGGDYVGTWWFTHEALTRDWLPPGTKKTGQSDGFLICVKY